MMDNMKPISKTKWIDEYQKMSSQYKIEERNLIQTFLVNDYHLSKIFKSLLQDEVVNEKKTFFDTEKSIKFFINEAYSYLLSANPNRAINNELNNKVKRIDNLLLKTRKEFKTKFEALLSEEETLEKELNNYEIQFEQMFNESNSNKEQSEESQNQITSNNVITKTKKNDIIDNYINSVMSAPGIIYDNEDDFSYNEIVKTVKKFIYSDLSLIKEKVEIIDAIIDKQLNGVNLGWQQKEHEDFLKIKNTHNGKIYSYEFLTELANTIPYLPVSEIKNHIKLYDKFSHLFEVKKIMIKKYKELKHEKEEEDKRKALEKIKEKKPKRKQSIDYESLENKKKLVKEWKEQKEKQNIEMERERMRQEKEKQEKERMMYMMKKERTQNQLEEYKKKKEYENYMRSNTSTTNTNVNPIDIERIREREEILLEKRKEALRAKSSKNFKMEESYTKFKLKQNKKFSAVDTKIYQTTEGWKKKQRTKFNPQTDHGKDACTMANNLLGHMSRAVPAWRKGFV